MDTSAVHNLPLTNWIRRIIEFSLFSQILKGFSLFIHCSADRVFPCLLNLGIFSVRLLAQQRKFPGSNSESNGCVIGHSSPSLVRLLSKSEDAKRAKDWQLMLSLLSALIRGPCDLSHRNVYKMVIQSSMPKYSH